MSPVQTKLKIAEFTRNGEATPSEVHMLVNTNGGVLIIQLKTERAVDEVIKALQDHKTAVFRPKNN